MLDNTIQALKNNTKANTIFVHIRGNMIVKLLYQYFFSINKGMLTNHKSTKRWRRKASHSLRGINVTLECLLSLSFSVHTLLCIEWNFAN